MNRTALLALDTSTEFCSVALGVAQEDAVAFSALHVRHEKTGSVSSSRLLPAVLEVLAEAGLRLDACSAIAFGAGPGSFTGLRTATGAAQGLAFGGGLPVVPVSTLMACAEAARGADAGADRVLVAMDARMDEAYWALYEWSAWVGEWAVISAPALARPEAIAVPAQPFTLAGNAHAAFGERLHAAACARVIDAQALPHAGPVAALGLRAWRRGEAVAPALAAPDYIRDKVAQTTAEREAARAEPT
ncbi:tRNA (adenosine(37)-N6)-threonylcarbamoyltransferase complex dimerization subunit type 1 TsaB [Pararobbsia alpina]|uniref:tRNA threonylcarbamoyladenosine biosynthesis protein TsaB n=1 Tax=Pararobbsia alpina TaxID=621374 RepID=A0A6S7BBT1_9BURK|nr:tRNA (adenosine(37)-N6)-threonylcarbamoyltransferase complex dimerization subunit type 1 TsaB [Pararobbsia alpina]CAB3794820.1 tRNA threonylcarbamoyladenosine biosynthesis protein TsaB [Pararobbsia alpina]